MRGHASGLVVRILIALLSAVVAVGAQAQSKADKIAYATKAGPPRISAQATVVDVDGTVLRPGTNGWTCMPGAAPGNNDPMCLDEVWVQLLDSLRSKTNFRTNRLGIGYMIAGDHAPSSLTDPFATDQSKGVWVKEGPHLMLILPDVSMLKGISEQPNAGGPYLMWKGTPYVHVMVPIGERAK